ncbi:MAG: hypothetical protein MUE72_12900 [Chitinophagaceae bacterium]|nr:hypothetical protein [Chitinophagaceae bacterium]
MLIAWANLESNKQEEIITYFKTHNIRPVLNDYVMAELIQGLKSSKNPYVQTKENITKFLTKINPIWILDAQYILALEYLNCEKNIEAHQNLKIFSNQPLIGSLQDKSYVRSYECDDGLNIRFIPYESVIIGKGNLVLYTIDLINNNLEDTKEAFQEGKVNNVNCIDFARAKGFSYNPETKMKIIKYYLLKYTNITEEKKAITLEAIKKAPFSCSPFDHVTDLCYAKRLKTGLSHTNKQGKKAPKEKENTFIDYSYATIAFSYCDYMITDKLTYCPSFNEHHGQQ